MDTPSSCCFYWNTFMESHFFPTLPFSFTEFPHNNLDLTITGHLNNNKKNLQLDPVLVPAAQDLWLLSENKTANRKTVGEFLLAAYLRINCFFICYYNKLFYYSMQKMLFFLFFISFLKKKREKKIKKIKTSFFKNFYYKMPENNHLHMLFQV